jgi:hypothetical protein
MPIRGQVAQIGQKTLAAKVALTLRRVQVVRGAGDAWPGRHRRRDPRDRRDRREQLGVQPRQPTVAAGAKVVLAVPAVAHRERGRVHRRHGGRGRDGKVQRVRPREIRCLL